MTLFLYVTAIQLFQLLLPNFKGDAKSVMTAFPADIAPLTDPPVSPFNFICNVNIVRISNILKKDRKIFGEYYLKLIKKAFLQDELLFRQNFKTYLVTPFLLCQHVN